MASGHVNRVNRPNTWLHRPMLQTFKKVLANSEPSTHGGKADAGMILSPQNRGRARPILRDRGRGHEQCGDRNCEDGELHVSLHCLPRHTTRQEDQSLPVQTFRKSNRAPLGRTLCKRHDVHYWRCRSARIIKNLA